jgi:serine O-acetyltransferase
MRVRGTARVSAAVATVAAVGSSAIETAVSELRAIREQARRRAAHRPVSAFPSRRAVAHVIDLAAAALYPRRLGGFTAPASGEDAFVAGKLIALGTELEREIGAELAYWEGEARGGGFDPDQPSLVVRLFMATLGEIRALIDSDVAAAFLGDPAARSEDEILLCYPGAIASLHHRIAHQLFQLGAPIVARLISELANERTGIDIHPGATIGPSFFVDHGTGVVIGETAIIGARVRLYQHVTLGARTPLGDATPSVRGRHARHPIVEDDVVIYAGSTILGRVTIGRGATIGGNVWLLSDVPAGSIVSQPEARVLGSTAADAVRDRLAER